MSSVNYQWLIPYYLYIKCQSIFIMSDWNGKKNSGANVLYARNSDAIPTKWRNNIDYSQTAPACHISSNSIYLSNNKRTRETKKKKKKNPIGLIQWSCERALNWTQSEGGLHCIVFEMFLSHNGLPPNCRANTFDASEKYYSMQNACPHSIWNGLA